jgi:hypothetical protein
VILARRSAHIAPLHPSAAPGLAGETSAPAREPWAEELGPRWRPLTSLLLLMVATAGFVAPLIDPDLAIHLATGGWIAQHGAVPRTEIFAWTRAGEPFYAYSWAIELVYYQLWSAFGAAGLQALHGVLMAVTVASIAWLGQVAGWRPWTTLLLATTHLLLALTVSAYLRPQLLLFIYLPVAWALTLVAWRAPSLRTRRALAALAGLALVSCLASNTHLLFPLTGLPLGLVALTAPRLDLKRAAVIALALVAGWVLSPYTLVWPGMAQQYLSGNALLTFPSPITEYRPGFSRVWGSGIAVNVLFLVALPWLLAAPGVAPLTVRERVWYGLAWTAGLITFAGVVRGLVIWWVALLPLLARPLDALPPISATSRRLRVAVLLLLMLTVNVRMVVAARRAAALHDPDARSLPTLTGASVEPFVDYLERTMRPGARGKVFTIFEYGGYLTWRAPALSPSIDGRTFFPDSIAGAETYHKPFNPPRTQGPWRSADLAIVPLTFHVAAVLDTATGWRRIATTPATARKGTVRSGLWVREAWWARVRQPRPAEAGR